MTIAEMDHQTARRICNGNEEAFDWMQMGRIAVHEIDDLIDEDLPQTNRDRGGQRVCRIGAILLDLYTHPFFLKNIGPLKEAMMKNTLDYSASVAWENSKVKWQKEFSDWARHGWVSVCITIARICGGYDHADAIKMELWTNAFTDHHDQATGKTI